MGKIPPHVIFLCQDCCSRATPFHISSQSTSAWFPSVQGTTSVCQATDDAAGQGWDFLQDKWHLGDTAGDTGMFLPDTLPWVLGSSAVPVPAVLC